MFYADRRNNVTNLHKHFANDHVVIVSKDGTEDCSNSVFLRFNVTALRTTHCITKLI